MSSLEFRVLEMLAIYGPLTATEMRDTSAVPRFPWQSYSAKCRSLRDRGFVTKGSDPASPIWRLTEKAKEYLAA